MVALQVKTTKINVTYVTLHCAISHQVTKGIKKLEERRSTLLIHHSKLQHVINSCELTNSSKELVYVFLGLQ
jgi:hypothetical protein